jgi:hypothetical protein
VGLNYVNPVTWALAISLAILAGVWTFFAFRRRRTAAVVRGLGLVILPFGLLLTGTLTLLLRILDAVSLWATRLVFSPMVWVGLLLVAVSAGLIAGGRAWGKRFGSPDAVGTSEPRSRAVERREATKPADPADAEMAEIEAILRKRGIS